MTHLSNADFSRISYRLTGLWPTNWNTKFIVPLKPIAATPASPATEGEAVAPGVHYRIGSPPSQAPIPEGWLDDYIASEAGLKPYEMPGVYFVQGVRFAEKHYDVAARRKYQLNPCQETWVRDAIQDAYEAALIESKKGTPIEPCRIAEDLVIDYRDAIQKLPANADINSPEYLEAMNAEEAILTVVKMAVASAPSVDAEALRPIFESTRTNLEKTTDGGIYWSISTQKAWRAFLDGAYAQIGR